MDTILSATEKYITDSTVLARQRRYLVIFFAGITIAENDLV